MSGVAVDDVQGRTCIPNLIICFKRVVEKTHTEDWLLDRIAISSPSLFQDTKISDQRPASHYFENDIWVFLEKHLAYNENGFILNSQEETFESSKYFIRGIVTFGLKEVKKIQKKFIVIKRIWGSPKDMFNNKCLPDLLTDLESKLSMQNLSGIAFPALNLIASSPGTRMSRAEAEVAAVPKKREASRNDVGFYATLISRFVASTEAGERQRLDPVFADTPPNWIGAQTESTKKMPPEWV